MSMAERDEKTNGRQDTTNKFVESLRAEEIKAINSQFMSSSRSSSPTSEWRCWQARYGSVPPSGWSPSGKEGSHNKLTEVKYDDGEPMYIKISVDDNIVKSQEDVATAKRTVL
ncbi:hypothetical protein N9L68_04825 [bacterium]|nr:hypothetical protein [bacterium]